ncbi:MAG: histidine phosphatase family protein [Anaerolineae bacterium]|nr:histidine phosphatase family protein [Anaerolineae bacterium]
MALLYLVRHARVRITKNVADPWPLSEAGQCEADTLARQSFWREVEIVFSSPELKARQTVEPAARRWSTPLEIVGCLREVHRPGWMPDYENAIKSFFSAPEASIEGMEPAAQAAERITRCIKGVVAAHPKQTLAVASHGLVCALFLARLENRWPMVTEWQAIPFAGVAVVDTTTTWHLVKDWSSVSKIS